MDVKEMTDDADFRGGADSSANLYANEAEWKRHHGHIDEIARENGKTVAEITECYERILAELKARAQVPDFVDVFVTRRVMSQIAARS